MRYGIGTGIAAVCLAVAGPRPAHAQDYAEQVWQQLQVMREAYSGFTLQNYVIGHIGDDRTDSWTFSLAGNSTYVIAGACDTDCSDLDIVVKDADGTIVGKDDTDDDVPIATFATKAAARYTIEVKMYACSEVTCYFGFGVLRQ
jgi:hypothetical protein